MTRQEFIDKNRLYLSLKQIDKRPDGIMRDMPRHFDCYISRDGAVNGMTVYFSQGSAHKVPPTLPEILECLASDAAGIENARDFEDWASEYGYETDSRKAEKIYDTCRKQATELRTMLGKDAYQELLWETNDDEAVSA